MKLNKWYVFTLILIAWVAPLGAVEYQPQDTWGDSVWAVRQAVQAYIEQSTFKPFHSDVMRARQKPQKVILPLNGIRKIALIATGVPNNKSSHAVWCNGVLTIADGSPTPLARLKPVYAKIGSEKLRVNLGYDNKPLSIAGKSFKHGFLAHADSRLVFELDKAYDQLEIYIGINDTAASGGCAVFAIEDASTDCEPLWNKLVADFPVECARAERDMGLQRCLSWLDPDKLFEFAVDDFKALKEDLQPNDQTMCRKLDEILAQHDSDARRRALLRTYGLASQKSRSGLCRAQSNQNPTAGSRPHDQTGATKRRCTARVTRKPA